MVNESTAPTAIMPAHRPRRQGNPWLTPVVWIVIAAAVGTAVTFGFALHRGDPEGAARIANSEIEASLERGERVVARATVSQRFWWDYYRHTWGVVAATDRRLLYIGVPPEPLLRRDPGPTELVIQGFPFARGIVLDRVMPSGGRRPALRVTMGPVVEQFAYVPADAGRISEVMGVVDKAQAALRAAADAERRATEAASAASRRPIYHLVQPGEALEFIARRYGVPVDSVIAWNSLPGPRINAGKRLLVRRGQEP